MGGMLVLEYAYFGPDYVRTIVPIATSSRHSAWGISWGEAQRQSIYCDPKYKDGYYDFNDPPSSGLGAARMSALLTYRSRDSFEARFGRNTPDPSKSPKINDRGSEAPFDNEHWQVHNEGHKTAGLSRSCKIGANSSPPSTLDRPEIKSSPNGDVRRFTDPQFHGTTSLAPHTPRVLLSEGKRATTSFSAQSYLRYQGEKFVRRFDGNCYISITRKLDTHDISKHRVPVDSPNPVALALSQIAQPTLVIGIESDGLFTFAEQQEMAASIPNARLRTIESPEGHDAFLLQFEQVNMHIVRFFYEVLPDIMSVNEEKRPNTHAAEGDTEIIAASSTFGETELDDITVW